MVFEVTVPKFIFPGFYNTNFDPDNVLEQELEENTLDYIEAYEYYQDSVLHNIIDHYNSVLPEEFKIVEYRLVSPKEYNYRNDTIELHIETTYEAILSHFLDYEEDYLLDYLKLDNYDSNQYHEAMLEVLLEFWPFMGTDLYETTLHEKFIYG